MVGGLTRGARAAGKCFFALADFPFSVRPGPRILTYHQVGAGLGRQMEVTDRAFAFHLRWLQENGDVVSLDEAIARRAERDSYKLFVLTFDDGYRDVYTRAFPRMAEAGVPFLLYLCTKLLEDGRGSDPEGRDEPLTWDQVAEMKEHGATIGSHTHSHKDLRKLSANQVEVEFMASDQLIEERLGTTSRHFCYPYGYWSHQADPLVRQRYETATLGGGAPLLPTTDLHLINRIPVQLSDGRLFFVRKMRSGMEFEERVRRLVKGYRGP